MGANFLKYFFRPTEIYNALTYLQTPLQQWGFRQCLPFSWTTLRGKYCQHPIAVMGIVDTFRQYLKGPGRVKGEIFLFLFVSIVMPSINIVLI